MSASILQAQAIAYFRAQFTAQEVVDIQTYAGQFSGSEIGRIGFNAPAILVAVLGWQPHHEGKYLTGRRVRMARLAAFVVTKDAASREARMTEAQTIAEKLAHILRDWHPDSSALGGTVLAPIEDEPRVENLYGRAVDAAGLGLWMADWYQCVKVGPAVVPTADLTQVEIIDTTHQGNADISTSSDAPITVTEEVDFAFLAPAT